MSTLFDMICALIALLMSAALSHFGGAVAPHTDASPPAAHASPAERSDFNPANQSSGAALPERKTSGQDA